MEPRKLNLLIATASYAGNGGTRSEVPDVRDWLLANVPKMQRDDRIGKITSRELADTPVTMVRNNMVRTARESGADLLLMIDSDMNPDMYLAGDPEAEPFWDVAFDFIYKRWDKGPNIVAAPYGGAPPTENCFVFHWQNCQSDHPDDIDMQLVQYSRHEAASMAGIHAAAALPTGLMLCDVRAFELTEPKQKGDRPWFYYEYTDIYETEKASTEDVTATRDISLAGIAKLGYNPIHCAWSSWAGHWKPKCVGKPHILTPDMVSDSFKRATQGDRLPSNKRFREIHTSIVDEREWAKATREGDGMVIVAGNGESPRGG